MNEIEEVNARFLEDVSEHTLESMIETEKLKNYVFSNDGGSNQKFGINVWPGFLCFYGDMGEFLISRKSDMLGFFRDLNMNNLGYFAEKTLLGEIYEFDFSALQGYFDENVKRWRETLVERVAEATSDEDKKRAGEILEDFDDYTEDSRGNLDFLNEQDSHAVLRDFNFGDGEFYFIGCDCPNFRAYSYRFKWFICAVYWALEQIDKEASND